RYASKDKRLMDARLSKKQIQWQAHVYWQLAWFFHKSGLQVIVRPFNSVRPYSFSVLKKISRNKNKLSKKEITPETDWSKEKNVKAWLQKSAPKDLIKKLKKS
ncbi:MAG: hypothetical protein KJO69_08855, partial [Gammaproteobacteria bacterium]|nr:hypothetical protein [Gammaproteobacteria bacterium]